MAVPRDARFDVWAPSAGSVLLRIGGSDGDVELEREGDGWWRPGALPSAAAGDDVSYGYVIDGAGPFPDPRSRRQPDGVHELSRTFDPGAHEWADAAWTGRALAGGVIYELHIGTFTAEGTFDAAIARLDHLVTLGVDFVELLPVNAFNGIHNWGYDGVLWYAVHEPYGGPAGYQRFVDACHAAGLGVIQDVVYNHLGPSGNYLPNFGPYLHDAAANTWGSALNLDGTGSDDVRRYIIDNALYWLRDMHVDGLRLDAVHALVDSRAMPLLEELAIEVDALAGAVRRPLSLVAESDLNDPRLIEERAAGGRGLTGQWSDDFHHAVHVAVSGETSGYYADFAEPGALARVIERGFFHDGGYSSFRERHHGRPIRRDTTPSWRLVVANQNHDQIGNRAIGDRLAASVDDGGLAIAAALTLLGPFTPMLFMGEEWAASTPWQFFTSHPEPELGEATARGRIAEFARMGWDESVVPDPQDPETFANSTLDWSELGGERHVRILEFYRALGALRRSEPGFTESRFGEFHVEHGDGWLLLARGASVLAVNWGPDASELPLVLAPGVSAEPALSFGAVAVAGDVLRLGPRSVAAFARDGGPGVS